jgi:FkbH-like protein
MEPVRLVIWDLDETYWQGTLTEGGITYNQFNHDVVVTLARRGIMSSICSKNELSAVKAVLEEHGIWDFFIFPSVNWEPKGERIGQLIEAVQLRPASVLFIDDNPQNLSEAKFFSPQIQVGDENLIPLILGDARFAGKNDENLSRLEQYKLLERRKKDEVAAGSDNQRFLRSCDIRVFIENDIEAHIDRAVELINRTNQLNFTKLRLPEEMEQARTALREMLARFNVQAGLIRVADNYGDYGYCGFFTVERTGNGSRLLHYCFSCRILGMGVERFVYERLNRPALTIRGEVLSDPNDASRGPVDWIRMVDDVQQAVGAGQKTGALPPIFLRGGCDLMILEHYFRMVTDEVQAEYSFNRNGIDIRIDHSLFARFSLEGVAGPLVEDFRALGYEPGDFRSTVLEAGPRGLDGCRIFSFLPDTWVAVYRSNTTDVLVPFVLDATNGQRDATALTPEEVVASNNSAQAATAVEFLKETCTYVGLLGETDFKDIFQRVLRSVPATSPIFVILAKDFYGPVDSPASKAAAAVNQNRWAAEVARELGNVRLIRIETFVDDPGEIQGNHFDRAVYFRMFAHIREVLTGLPATGTGSDPARAARENTHTAASSAP